MAEMGGGEGLVIVLGQHGETVRLIGVAILIATPFEDRGDSLLEEGAETAADIQETLTRASCWYDLGKLFPARF